MDYKKIIAEIVNIDGISAEEILTNISKISEDGLGDYCLPCFRYAKKVSKSPMAIAEDVCASIDRARQQNPSSFEWLEKIESVKGYINFFLDKQEVAAKVLPEVLQKGSRFDKKPANGKTVCIEFSSVNIAKPFHIGHLLTTIIGASLHRIYTYLGYNTVAINHLGDWGTQFGKMIVAYLKWGEGRTTSQLTIEYLTGLYVRFHQEAESDQSLNDLARAWFRKLEDGDAEALRLFRSFKEVTLREIKRVYKKLDVKFDSYKGESFFNIRARKAAELLRQKGLLEQSDGAEVVSLKDDNMPPCLIFKSDGTTLYATRDIATAIYRKEHYNFDKCLYIVAYQQELHFKQVFKVLEKMGYEWAKDCVHVPFGMVSLEGEGSLSTRKGNVVYLSDVLDTSVQKAADIIEAKNPTLSSKRRVASAVGIGAVIFGALANSRIKDVCFSYEKALNFEGETAAYIQYTHARCSSVLKKAAKTQPLDYTGVDYQSLADEQAYKTIKLLNDYDPTVALAAEKYEPSIISKYLIDLAQAYNKFYMDNRIITDNKDTTKARLLLTECTRRTLKNGLDLLMIKSPERM